MKRIVQLTESDFDKSIELIHTALEQLGKIKRPGQSQLMAIWNLESAINILTDKDSLDKKVGYLESIAPY